MLEKLFGKNKVEDSIKIRSGSNENYENKIRELKEQIRILEEENKEIVEKQELISSETTKMVKNLLKLRNVADMLEELEEQTKLIEDGVFSSSEISKATEDISNFVQDSSRTMDETVESTNESLESIYQTFAKIEENILKTNDIKLVMDDVTEETKKINEMVSVIKDVADRTNLLALNASIEAARAGEHGKGFAVVAEEIKKLADSTKEQVGYIQEIVDELNIKVGDTSKEIDSVVSDFNNSKESIDHATNNIEQIKTSMDRVSNSLIEISANVEEQTATTEEMSANFLTIEDRNERVKEKIIATGESFFLLAYDVNYVRNSLVDIDDENLGKDKIIDCALMDNAVWNWHIKNRTLGHSPLDSSQIVGPTECRFSKWLKRLEGINSEVDKLLEQVHRVHNEFHEASVNTLKYYNMGDIARSDEYIDLMNKTGEEIRSLMNQIRHVI